MIADAVMTRVQVVTGCFGGKARGDREIIQTRILRAKSVFFFQAEDGIRDAQESRGLGDVYKRQRLSCATPLPTALSTR